LLGIKSGQIALNDDCQSVKLNYHAEIEFKDIETGAISKLGNIKPLFFLKQVCFMFASVLNEEFTDANLNFRKFIYEPDFIDLDTQKYNLYMYFLKSQIYHHSQVMARSNISKPNQSTTFSELCVHESVV